MPKLYFDEAYCSGTLVPDNESIAKDLKSTVGLPLNASTYSGVSQGECDQVKSNINDAITITTRIDSWIDQAIINFQAFEDRTLQKTNELSKFQMKLFNDITSLNGKNFNPNQFMNEIEKLLAAKDFGGINVNIEDVRRQLKLVNENGNRLSEQETTNGTLFKNIKVDGVSYDVWVPNTNAKGSTLYFHGQNGDNIMNSYADYINSDQVLIVPKGITGFDSNNTISNSVDGFKDITSQVFGDSKNINVAGHSMGVKAALNSINTTGTNFKEVTLISGQSYGAALVNIPKDTKINIVYSTNDTGSEGCASDMQSMYNFFKQNGYNVSGGQFIDNPAHASMFYEGINNLNNPNIKLFDGPVNT